ncbi:dynein axonemal heavy chain 7-like [Prorops nasuta]|uniref:dynein axonemal heavy chain 7-like n=1 Tax=Prorops nasuta TaxID=863751 RepID=UPI0034CD929B
MKSLLKPNLHLLNPCMLMLLEEWMCHFHAYRLIDINEIEAYEGVWDILNFKETIINQIVLRKSILQNDWYNKIRDIYLQVNLLRFNYTEWFFVDELLQNLYVQFSFFLL